jgi:Domain of unknown function (DUF4340)
MVEAEITMARRKNTFKGKGTLLAVGIALLLGAWAHFFEKGPVVEPGETPAVSALAEMQADDVSRVEIKADGPALILARQGEQWQIEQPLQARADNDQVKQLVQGLLDAHVERVVATEATDFKPFGLDKPKLAVTLTDKGGKKRVVQVGDKYPAQQNSLYARLAEDPRVFMLPSYTVDSLKNKHADDLRDKTALAVTPDKTTRITIAKGDRTVVVERKGKDAWELTRPIRAPADKDEITSTLDQAKNLRIEKFFPERPTDPEKYGLKPPETQITITGEDGKDATLLLGKPVPGAQTLYAMRGGDPQLFALRKTAAQDLGKGVEQLRDKTLLSFKRDDMQRLAITSPAGAVDLTRDGADWKVTKPFQAKAKKEKLDDLLFTLESVKGSRFVEDKPTDLAKYGLDAPQAKVSVWLKGDSTPKELAIGKQRPDKTFYAKSTSQDAVFTVPEYTVSDLKLKPEDLKG